MPMIIAVDREAAMAWYRRNRQRSDALFDLIAPDAYYSRPIALRNPIVFYEGHLPAFSVIAFLRRGLGRPPVDERLEALFARGIDPDSEDTAVPRSGAATRWPAREEVRRFARRCDDAILDALAGSADLPLEGLYTALEHEAMHQETLLYMWHRLPYEQKRRPEVGGQRLEVGGERLEVGGEKRLEVGGQRLEVGGESAAPASGTIRIPAGMAALGAARRDVPFGWDNEFDAHDVHVAEFDIDALPVTNREYLEFVNDGGYRARELWTDEGWGWIQQEHVACPAFWIPPFPPDSRPSSFIEPPTSPLPTPSNLQPLPSNLYPRPPGTGAACSTRFPCRPTGPCTSARPKRVHTLAGRAAA